MFVETLKTTLITAGLLIGIPIFPDWGIQLAIAFFIGMFLPEKSITPIDNFIKMILPPVKIFEEKLKKFPRFKKFIPRIIAGYLFTFLIGIALITIGLLL
jgi:hypothetical protein